MGIRFHYVILLGIPPIIFAIAFIQVKCPIVEIPSFQTALQEHNKELVIALDEKTVNASISMNDELERLRRSLRGRQNGEKSDFKTVLHVSMGIGDSSLPYRIEWLPILMCCFITVSVLIVSLVVIFSDTVDALFSDSSTSEMDTEFVPSNLDIVLRKRKIENPHQPVETTEVARSFDVDSNLSRMSAKLLQPIAPAFFPMLILVGFVVIQTLVLFAAQGGGIGIKIFGIFRRAATLSPMPCETVLDYTMLVLNFPNEVLFFMIISRMASSLNSLFHFLFAKEKKEELLVLTAN